MLRAPLHKLLESFRGPCDNHRERSVDEQVCRSGAALPRWALRFVPKGRLALASRIKGVSVCNIQSKSRSKLAALVHRPWSMWKIQVLLSILLGRTA